MARMKAVATIGVTLPESSFVNDSVERGRKMSSANSHMSSTKKSETANSGMARVGVSRGKKTPPYLGSSPQLFLP